MSVEDLSKWKMKEKCYDEGKIVDELEAKTQDGYYVRLTRQGEVVLYYNSYHILAVSGNSLNDLIRVLMEVRELGVEHFGKEWDNE